MKTTWINADILHNLKGEEKLNAVWNNIEYIKQQLIEEKKIEKEKEKNKKKERTRKINIPLHLCKDFNEMTNEYETEAINFYEQVINNTHYIFDIFQTSNMKFFVRVTDVTDNNYNVIDFNDFKKKYAQPSLFDYFDI